MAQKTKLIVNHNTDRSINESQGVWKNSYKVFILLRLDMVDVFLAEVACLS